jgi:hypothetical protein
MVGLAKERMCVCVCVCEREREREGGRMRDLLPKKVVNN